MSTAVDDILGPDLARLLRALPEPEPEPAPVTAPLADLPRLLAAGLIDGYDFRREPLNAREDHYVARTRAGQRWMVPQIPDADGRAPSRRFVPTEEQGHYSALLAGLYQVCASEAEVIEHLSRDGERRRAEWMRLAELTVRPLRAPTTEPR